MCQLPGVGVDEQVDPLTLFPDPPLPTSKSLLCGLPEFSWLFPLCFTIRTTLAEQLSIGLGCTSSRMRWRL